MTRSVLVIAIFHGAGQYTLPGQAQIIGFTRLAMVATHVPADGTPFLIGDNQAKHIYQFHRSKPMSMNVEMAVPVDTSMAVEHEFMRLAEVVKQTSDDKAVMRKVLMSLACYLVHPQCMLCQSSWPIMMPVEGTGNGEEVCLVQIADEGINALALRALQQTDDGLLVLLNLLIRNNVSHFDL